MSAAGHESERRLVLMVTYSDLFQFVIMLRSVYKELHADHETGAADNK